MNSLLRSSQRFSYIRSFEVTSPVLKTPISGIPVFPISRLHHVQVQSPAPAFQCEAVLPDGSFGTLSLDSFKVVAFSDHMEEFKALGAQVVGASVDTKFSHLQWTNTPRNLGGVGKLKIPLLADPSHTLSKAYDSMLPSGLCLRSLFIIDPNGTLQQMTVNSGSVGRNVTEVLRCLEALKEFEKNGQVCPAGWQKGSPTIKATPKGSQSFFSKLK